MNLRTLAFTLALTAALLAAMAGCGAPAAASSAAAGAQSAASTAGAAAAQKTVAPYPQTVDLANPEDGIYPAAFKADGLQTSANGTTLTVTLFTEDIYDAVEVGLLAPGDTFQLSGSPITVTTVEKDANGGIVLNGGLESGGCTLVSNGGGTYRVTGLDDYPTYTEQGSAALPLAPDCTFTDSSDLEQKSPVVTAGDALATALPALKNQNFSCYGTTVRLAGGKIVEITRIYTP